MPTREYRDRWWLLRAGSGVALLLAGLIVLTVGGAGVLTGLFRSAGAPTGTARTAAFTIVALAPPVVLFFATTSVTADVNPRRVAGAGATLGVASATVLGLVGFAGLTAGRQLPLLLAGGYVIGTVLSFAGLINGVSASDPARRQRGADVSWQASDRSLRRAQSGVAPADGGSTDSELSFPLDQNLEDADEDERD
ncbi:MAG: hypothetical protein U5K70_03560 [Halodesulfurarchaeum sp.]|nr:hypothetical protein [Halodesulfurarchaeum sp.]